MWVKIQKRNISRNIPSAATVHTLSKQTTQGSWHVGAEALLLHPHSLQMTTYKIRTQLSNA